MTVTVFLVRIFACILLTKSFERRISLLLPRPIVISPSRSAYSTGWPLGCIATSLGVWLSLGTPMSMTVALDAVDAMAVLLGQIA